MSPSRVISHMKHYKLVYGKKLDPKDFDKGCEIKQLKALANFVDDTLLPGYDKKFHFDSILKQVFWLTDKEQEVLGKNPPHSWKKLARSIKDKNHIMHDAVKYRFHKPKDKKVKAAFKKKFIAKLKRYIKKMKKIK